MEDNEAPFVVLKLEEELENDPGHSTLTIHGDSEIVSALAAAVALLMAALAEEDGAELFDPRELLSEEGPEEDLAESA